MEGNFRVSNKLLDWLSLKGWTQRQLAKELKCNESLVSRWFDEAKPRHPSWQMFRKLCLLTGLDMELLVFDRGVENTKENNQKK